MKLPIRRLEIHHNIQQNFPINIKEIICIRSSVADPDPGSGAFLPTGSGIRDVAIVGSGYGIRDKQIKFVNSLYTKIGRIRDPDPGWSNVRVRIRDPG
jgi:hypothetical protein